MEFSDDERLSLQRLLRWRRDVRHFRTDPVPEALLDTLKEAMSLAPSVGNARPWRVLRVENLMVSVTVNTPFASSCPSKRYDLAIGSSAWACGTPIRPSNSTNGTSNRRTVRTSGSLG